MLIVFVYVKAGKTVMENIEQERGRIKPLSANRHKGLAVLPPQNFLFASGINSVPLTITEFGRASVCFPILFTRSADSLAPVALLGLRPAQSLCVDAEGAWTEDYVPAFLRCYPFIIGQSSDGLKVCIDEAWHGLNRSGRGELLFDSDGEATSYLKGVVAFLTEYQRQSDITRKVVARLNNLGILDEGHIDFESDSGDTNRVSGVYTIRRDKLLSLGADVLHSLNSSHLLEYSFNHIHSLARLEHLLNRLKGL